MAPSGARGQLESWRFDCRPFVRANDEALTLETSAFQILHGGNSIFINSFDKTKFPCSTFPPMQHHTVFRNKNFVNCSLNNLVNYIYTTSPFVVDPQQKKRFRQCSLQRTVASSKQQTPELKVLLTMWWRAWHELMLLMKLLSIGESLFTKFASLA